jgi:beta-galactosidase
VTSAFDRREFLAAMAAITAGSVLPASARQAADHTDTQNRSSKSAPRLEFGADYYPEDWPSERWEIDARLMRQAKFRTVRLADTNWERLEPAEGNYDFAWLDRVLEILNRQGIRAVLCTSSYVPPAWLVEKHPDFYSVNEAGVRHRWGGMGFMCLNHPLYRQYVEKLVTALATHYGRHPGVIGWQIDNEMGIWGAECYDETYCVPKFQQYLKSKYQTIDELNRRLLTVSYGHTYSDWKQVLLRSDVAEDALQAPLVLESKRFFSGNIADFLAFQAELLRRHTSGQFITHNGPLLSMNCFAFAAPLDFLSEDNYPRTGEFTAPGFHTDLMRGFNHGKSFLALEIRSGSVGPYTLHDATPPPGLARLWAWQRLAHGADGVLFFRWRMNNGGSEQYWQGLLNYDGTPSAALPEVTRMGAELEAVGSEFAGAGTPSVVAAILSYDSLFALDLDHSKFPYLEQFSVFSGAFRRWSLNVDFVEPSADLHKYKVVLAPSLHVVDEAIARNLETFVKQGGVLVLSARSGFKNEDNLSTETPPGPLETLAKVRVKNFTLLETSSEQRWVGFPIDSAGYKASPENLIQSASADWQGEYVARVWADILEPDGAEVLFHYGKDYYAGQAAVTLARSGQGKVVYVGTLVEPRFYADLAKHVCEWGQVEIGPELPEGVDFALRENDRGPFRFLLNFSNSAKTVALAGYHRDLISTATFTDQVTVPPLDLRVLVPGTPGGANPAKV